MKQTNTVAEAREWCAAMRRAGLSIGLVPTMGALHEGHFSLLEAARRECDRVAVSIFVNPTQFGPGEDLDRYPSSPEDDLRVCRERGADLVFVGDLEGRAGVYSPGFQTWVEVEELSRPLCGRFRQGHFRGVATVVQILLGIFRPDRAYFGLKDYQQARLIERMARDLHAGVDVRLLPTVRDPDGLASSSRNRNLSPSDREVALRIPRALESVSCAFQSGERSVSVLLEKVRANLNSVPGLEVEYVEMTDAMTLEPPGSDTIAGQGVVIAVAAQVGTGNRTRLIDNVWLH